MNEINVMTCFINRMSNTSMAKMKAVNFNQLPVGSIFTRQFIRIIFNNTCSTIAADRIKMEFIVIVGRS
ncbi:MAG: hypothetical protein ABIN36_02740 [Ferruginibacter sp.]